MGDGNEPREVSAWVAKKLAQPRVTVDLGCGTSKAGDIGIDFTPALSQVDIVCNLGFEPIPLPNNSIDHCFAYDFLEHLPKSVNYKENGRWETHRPHLFLFNEVYRILKPNGLFDTRTPISEPEVSGRALHVSVWNRETFYCFTSKGPYLLWDWSSEADSMRRHGYKARFEMSSYSEEACMPGWTLPGWNPFRKTHARAVFVALK